MPKLTDGTIKNSLVGERSDAQTPGLSLITRASTSKAKPNAKRRIWTDRFTLDRKRQKMGLGAYPAVSLEEARRQARLAASVVSRGLDPRLPRCGDPDNLTFAAAVEDYLVNALPRLASEKSRYGLRHALGVHAKPLHDRPVLEIGTRDVAAFLKSLAAASPRLAERVRGDLRGLFAYVVVAMEDQGRSVRNPVLSESLKAAGYVPAPSVAHHPALDPAEAPAFMQALRSIPSMDARLLEFVILTVSRAGAARVARFDQIDAVRAVWTVPPEQLKDRKHRRGEAFCVPLASRALAIVEEMRALQSPAPSNALIFDGSHDMTLVSLVRRMCHAHQWRDPTSKKPISTHGFRATFRTFFQGPKSKHSREVVEIAMGHRFHGAVEKAYARDSLLDERRKLLDDWAKYLDPPLGGTEVVPLRRA
jgi:integrase